jgi:translocation and assembly module TamA
VPGQEYSRNEPAPIDRLFHRLAPTLAHTPIVPASAARALACAVLVAGCAVAATQAGAAEVIIEGVPKRLETHVRANMSIVQEPNTAALGLAAMRALHRRAREEIRSALEPYGYYRAEVEADLKRGETDWIATYRVHRGPAVRIRSLDVRVTGAAQTDPEFVALLAHLPMREGGILEHLNYESAKKQLTTLAADRGYFDSNLVRHEVRVDVERSSAAVALHLDSGPRYAFGEVRFEPGSGLSADLLARYVPFRPGEEYRAEQVHELRRAFVDSGYFAQIEVTPRRDLASDEQVPIVIKLTPRAPNEYKVGFGYGTDTGVRGKASWDRRLVSEEGHRVLTELSASQIRTDLTSRYLIPGPDPRTDQWSFNAGYIAEYPETSNSRKASAGVAYSAAVGEWRLTAGRVAGWRSTYSASFEREDWETGLESGHTQLILPAVSWLYLNTDNRLVTTQGGRWQTDVRGSAKAIASDVTFGQLLMQGKLIWPLGERGRIITRADAGTTWTSDFSAMPSSLRFYAGGDQSVRGYDYHTLGPVDAAGNVVGGESLLVGSVEYEHRLKGKWSAAMFYDVGNAFNDRSGSLFSGTGAGVRWRSPIGLLRLDVAWAISLDDRPWRIHFVIGPDL